MTPLSIKWRPWLLKLKRLLIPWCKMKRMLSSLHTLFRVPFACLALWLKVSLPGILPTIATFDVSFDVFGEIHVFCIGFWIFTRWLIVCSAMENYLFWGKFLGRFDVIFHTLCFGSTNQSSCNMVFTSKLYW